jgi:hypothetical protein
MGKANSSFQKLYALRAKVAVAVSQLNINVLYGLILFRSRSSVVCKDLVPVCNFIQHWAVYSYAFHYCLHH